MSNPYIFTFGKTPNQQISRFLQTTEIVNEFLEDEPSNQVFILTGVRGSGKTVLMTEISNKLSQESDWITVELNPSSDMLKSLGSKLLSNEKVSSFLKTINISVNLFGVEISKTGDNKIIDMETAVSEMLATLKKHNKKLLITVDEVTDNEYVRNFTSAFQIFVRQNAPIYLLMTGLFENVSELQNEKNLTFLYRAPKSVMKPLNLNAISKNYQTVIGVNKETADKMAEMTKGYSYGFQVLGHLTYENNGSYEEIIDIYKQYLEEYVYEKIWSELSNKDKEVIKAIASIESGRILEIREFLGMETNDFNPYRKRLIRKGLIDGDTRGYVRLMLPYFGEFALMN